MTDEEKAQIIADAFESAPGHASGIPAGLEDTMGRLFVWLFGLVVGGLALSKIKTGHASEPDDEGPIPTSHGPIPAPPPGYGYRGGLREVARVDPGYQGADDFLARILPALRQVAIEYGYPSQAGTMIAAQCALETGWGKAAGCYNLGGIHAGSNWKGPYFRSTDAGNPTKFCAFKDEYDFARQGIFRLLNYGIYKESKRYLMSLDETYFYQVGADGYHGSDPDKYGKSCVQILETIKAKGV